MESSEALYGWDNSTNGRGARVSVSVPGVIAVPSLRPCSGKMERGSLSVLEDRVRVRARARGDKKATIEPPGIRPYHTLTHSPEAGGGGQIGRVKRRDEQGQTRPAAGIVNMS